MCVMVGLLFQLDVFALFQQVRRGFLTSACASPLITLSGSIWRGQAGLSAAVLCGKR